MKSVSTLSIFDTIHSTRRQNDRNNKKREEIIAALINNEIPQSYYDIPQWKKIKDAVDSFIETLNCGKVRCVHLGGRKFNHDFDFITPEKVFHVELKFNATSIETAPQFVSPMNPSRYLSQSYEEYFYNNYLSFLSNKIGLPLPLKEDYLNEINTPNPKCMEKYQDAYYKGCSTSSKYSGEQEHTEFYNLAKEKSKESISTFIQETTLNTEALTKYFQATQKDKIYMLYSNGKFIKQEVNMDDYFIESVVPNKYRYEATCKSGKQLNILLRWKNGNGIAFPAFQISQR